MQNPFKVALIILAITSPALAFAQSVIQRMDTPYTKSIEVSFEMPKPVEVIPALVWTLTAGQTVGHELKAWGEKAEWKVIWNLSKDWAVPASTSFTGDFPAVAAAVIKTLAANGALVRAQFYEGNKTLVVNGPGVAAQ